MYSCVRGGGSTLQQYRTEYKGYNYYNKGKKTIKVMIFREIVNNISFFSAFYFSFVDALPAFLPPPHMKCALPFD